jgi:hypothetical protein
MKRKESPLDWSRLPEVLALLKNRACQLCCPCCGAEIPEAMIRTEMARLMNQRRKGFHRHSHQQAVQIGKLGAEARWGKRVELLGT